MGTIYDLAYGLADRIPGPRGVLHWQVRERNAPMAYTGGENATFAAGDAYPPALIHALQRMAHGAPVRIDAWITQAGEPPAGMPAMCITPDCMPPRVCGYERVRERAIGDAYTGRHLVLWDTRGAPMPAQQMPRTPSERCISDFVAHWQRRADWRARALQNRHVDAYIAAHRPADWPLPTRASGHQWGYDALAAALNDPEWIGEGSAGARRMQQAHDLLKAAREYAHSRVFRWARRWNRGVDAARGWERSRGLTARDHAMHGRLPQPDDWRAWRWMLREGRRLDVDRAAARIARESLNAALPHFPTLHQVADIAVEMPSGETVTVRRHYHDSQRWPCAVLAAWQTVATGRAPAMLLTTGYPSLTFRLGRNEARQLDM